VPEICCAVKHEESVGQLWYDLYRKRVIEKNSRCPRNGYSVHKDFGVTATDDLWLASPQSPPRRWRLPMRRRGETITPNRPCMVIRVFGFQTRPGISRHLLNARRSLLTPPFPPPPPLRSPSPLSSAAHQGWPIVLIFEWDQQRMSPKSGSALGAGACGCQHCPRLKKTVNRRWFPPVFYLSLT